MGVKTVGGPKRLRPNPRSSSARLLDAVDRALAFRAPWEVAERLASSQAAQKGPARRRARRGV